ncbi:MAG: sulfotransferase [Flavobacteriales bacterium]|nr:sulfotransferase [Flavobacteriales bacterium]MCW8937711.1 sulfotransferase [Flavobacteriales bacterium]MCW8968572.1 sulfotransferase [Flavobacteriales bacterium]MCW8990199.1 sulfotransferase [Flavobacteriales bacterium]MCW9019917.1 sulfotransferase [Flavobacteriales bacterium]
MGMPKAGTTAIAALLGKKTGQKTMLDTPFFWYPYNFLLLKKEITLKNHLIKHSSILKNKIIKEPNFTLLFDEFYQLYPKAKFIFIVRNPKDNIRSILNRLNLPGNLPDFTAYDELPKSWQSLFYDYYSSKNHYIEKLADMWVKYNNIYLQNKERFILIKYEDFIKNKEVEIVKLAKSVGLNPQFDIKDIENKQFQPKGNQNILLDDFFEENIKYIHQITLNLEKRLYDTN